MLHDPIFWAVAVVSVLITGVSKGGFGGLALLAVPLMALVISPVQAAGIMLPILIVMDWVSVLSYRKHWDKRILWLTLPGAVAGIAAGGLLAGYVDDQFVRVCVGIIAVGFPLYVFFKPKGQASLAKGSRPLGVIAGGVAGFTSFIAHAGGPPFQAYAIPQGLEKRTYAGTSVMFFFVVNMVKVVPYAMLGQFDATNVATSLILIPLAPVGVLLGVWLVKRIDQQVFFRIIYGLIFSVGLKLLWDGLVA
jgi:uncharacterized membrane protein YfcA